MAQENSKDIEQSQEQVADELTIESIKERVKGLKQEVERFTTNLKLVTDSIEEGKKRFETSEKIIKLVLSNPKRLSPEYAYEATPEYWDLRKQEVQYQLDDNFKKFSGDISMAEARVRDIQASLKSSQDQLDRDIATLKEKGVVIDG